MDKKTLSIILGVSIVAVAGIVYFGYQKGFFSGAGIGGIREDSMMGAMGKQGQKVISKSEFINECKKSSADTQDDCYGVGAFYYRDASFCKYVKSPEMKSQCTQENIEKMYSGGGMVPGDGIIPGGIIPGGGPVPEGGVVPDTKPEAKEEPIDFYGLAKEIAMPNAQASELKSIFGEACGGAKLTQLLHNPMDPTSKEGDILVYVWKNKPTEEKLISAFEKEGYEIESPGSPLFVKKGNLTVVISWEEEMNTQEIGVTIMKEE